MYFVASLSTADGLRFAAFGREIDLVITVEVIQTIALQSAKKIYFLFSESCVRNTARPRLT